MCNIYSLFDVQTTDEVYRTLRVSHHVPRSILHVVVVIILRISSHERKRYVINTQVRKGGVLFEQSAGGQGNGLL